jgi:sugar lactone lactonase YvrE
MVKEFQARVLFRPPDPRLAFLPEGPYPCGKERISWVAIQHGATATTGSLNLLDVTRGENRSLDLPGRPGFAFPTNRLDTFVVGMERRICLVDAATGRVEPLLEETVDPDVDGTIINDGLVLDRGLVFGCKDLAFRDPKAGLYLWRREDRKLVTLRNDQICSNGKVVLNRDGQWTLLDIDSPTKTVAAYALNIDAGRVGEPSVVVDLRDGDAFPDGMIATPDGQGVIVALYDPTDKTHGQARQYRIESGELEAVWHVPASPQVTCPQLVETNGRVQLILTTAVEHMTRQRQRACTNAGCLFIAETNFDTAPAAPAFVLPDK